MTTVDVSLPERKPRRWPRRLFWAALWLATALGLAWLVAFLLASWDYTQAKAALDKRNEPASFIDAAIRNLEKADYPNAADHLSEALREYAQAGRPLNSLAQQLDYHGPISPSDFAEVEDGLSRTRRVMTLLDESFALPSGPLTSPVDAEDATKNFRFPVSQELRMLARLLSIEARYAAERGDARLAFKRLKSIYLLSEQLSAEKFLVPQYIRMHMIYVGNSTARRVLGTIDLLPEEFGEFDAILAGIDRTLRLYPALVNERAFQATILDARNVVLEELRYAVMNRRTGPSTLTQKAVDFMEQRWVEMVSSPLGFPVRRRAAAETLSIPNEALQLVDKPPPWDAETRRQFDRWKEMMFLDRLTLNPKKSGGLQYAGDAALRAHRNIAMMRMALRMKRHRQLHGKLPSRLEAICDAAMPELPTTWFEGKPFTIMRFTEPGFRIEASESLTAKSETSTPAKKQDDGLLIEIFFGNRSKQ
jgi:hypothetical protein